MVGVQYHQRSTMTAGKTEQIGNHMAKLEQQMAVFRNIVNQMLEAGSDFEILLKTALEARGSLDSAQNDLQNLSDELAQFFHHVCTVNGETPWLVEREIDETENAIEWFKTLSKNYLPIEDLEVRSFLMIKAKENSESIEILMDVMFHLRIEVEHIIAKLKLKENRGNVPNDSECE